MKITEEPRQILQKLGYELIEMKHNRAQSRCCGGGGEQIPLNPKGVIEYMEGEVLVNGAPAEIGLEIDLCVITNACEDHTVSVLERYKKNQKKEYLIPMHWDEEVLGIRTQHRLGQLPLITKGGGMKWYLAT